MKQAVIISGYRSAITKANKGAFKNTLPDDIAVQVIQALIANLNIDPLLIDDVIVGNAVPEAEQGLQIGRMIALRAVGIHCAGMVINRYCASGLEAIALATAKIRAGHAQCIIAGGAESMSLVPTVGWKTVPNYSVAATNPDYYLSMGLTAEMVAKEFSISRQAQDEFACNSHAKAIKAIDNKEFDDAIIPITIEEVRINDKGKKDKKVTIVQHDEGFRRDTTLDNLSKLKPVFAQNGTVTAGNSSQTSDGAAFVLIMSDSLAAKLGLHPKAELIACASAGVHPRIMGIGPVEAIPKALLQANLNISDISTIELNEAFAAQALAVIKQLNLNNEIINPFGGAIALGHPLGCSLAKLSLQQINNMCRTKAKYGLVSACVGGGQGIAGVFQNLDR